MERAKYVAVKIMVGYREYVQEDVRQKTVEAFGFFPLREVVRMVSSNGIQSITTKGFPMRFEVCITCGFQWTSCKLQIQVDESLFGSESYICWGR